MRVLSPHSNSDRPNISAAYHSEWIVTNGHDDVIVGRRSTPDPREGFTLDLLVLDAERDAAIVSLVDVLPETRRDGVQ